MMIWSLQFCVGLLVANAGEWCMHRYLLHYYGKRAGSFLGLPLGRASLCAFKALLGKKIFALAL